MKTRKHRGFTLIEIMIVVAIIAVLAAIAIPNLTSAISKARSEACAANRRSIDGAKMQWALEHKKDLSDVPTDADLFGASSYIDHKPDCPAGGAYELRAVQEKCHCSVVKHAP